MFLDAGSDNDIETKTYKSDLDYKRCYEGG